MTPTLVPALASGGFAGFSRCLVGGGLIPDQSMSLPVPGTSGSRSFAFEVGNAPFEQCSDRFVMVRGMMRQRLHAGRHFEHGFEP